MGLLDEAIREHLELKRRRGADPTEVAREQREALAEGYDDEAATGDHVADASVDSLPTVASAEPIPGGEAAVAGETAELDMSTVLGDETEADEGDHLEARAGGAEEDSLEWEMPAREARAAAESAATDETPPDADPDAPVEDVLEATPDFLRDTPEQERMWFEQRPPRDFDFDG